MNKNLHIVFDTTVLSDRRRRRTVKHPRLARLKPSHSFLLLSTPIIIFGWSDNTFCVSNLFSESISCVSVMRFLKTLLPLIILAIHVAGASANDPLKPAPYYEPRDQPLVQKRSVSTDSTLVEGKLPLGRRGSTSSTESEFAPLLPNQRGRSGSTSSAESALSLGSSTASTMTQFELERQHIPESRCQTCIRNAYNAAHTVAKLSIDATFAVGRFVDRHPETCIIAFHLLFNAFIVSKSPVSAVARRDVTSGQASEGSCLRLGSSCAETCSADLNAAKTAKRNIVRRAYRRRLD
ncbi:hypothetical protein C8R42DRAFT_654814 [Lentinula raphanica]|nr:hypothetical protein C8R42DRAFT_654814 [Lentinula raphanica]